MAQTDASRFLAGISQLSAGRYTSAEEEIQALLQLLSEQLGMRSSFLAQINRDENRWVLLAAHNEPDGCGLQPGSAIHLPQTFCSGVAGSVEPSPLLLGDTRTATEFAAAAAAWPNIGSYVGVPIILSDGSLFGTLCAVDPEPRTLSPQQADLLLVLARLVATHIERDREVGRRQDLEKRLAEDRFRSLVRNSSDIIFVVDAEGIIQLVSPSVERVLGYKYQDLLGNSGFDLVHPDDLHLARGLLERTLRAPRTIQTSDLRMKHLNGNWRYIGVTGSNALADPGVEGVVFNARDITERKDVEEALLRRDAILQAVSLVAKRFLERSRSWQETVQAALGELGRAAGADRAYVFENHAAQGGQLLTSQRYEWVAPGIAPQIDRAELQGLSWQEAGFGRWLEVLTRGETVHGLVREFPESERAELEAEGIKSIVVVPIFVDHEWWGHLGFDACATEREWSTPEIGALRAASSALAVAIQRQRIEVDLRRSEERFRALIQNASDVIDVIDADGTILYVSPSIERVLGYSPDERMGKSIYYAPILHPDSLPTVEALFGQVLGTSGGSAQAEVRARHKDGSWRYLEGEIRNLLHDPAIGGIVVNYRDITERKRAEEEVRRSEDLDRLRSEFISTVSHELLTPITAIRAGLGMLEAGASNQLGHSEQQLLTDARVNTQRLGRLIDDLLAYNQLEAGTLALNSRLVDLRSVVRASVSSIHSLIQQKGQTLEVDLKESLPMEGDPQRLEQVVVNLLANAHRHTPGGSRVVVSARMTDSEIRLSVSDNGPGIPAKELQNIFDRFHTVTGTGEGSGLGLAIAKRMVELHRGRIWADSELGRGASFHVALPRTDMPVG